MLNDLTEERFIEAIRTKKANIDLVSSCTHCFRWDAHIENTPCWEAACGDGCYCDACITIGDEDAGFIDGLTGATRYYRYGYDLIPVEDDKALEEALEAYGWDNSQQVDETYWSKRHRLSTCANPTKEDAIKFLEDEGFTHFYVDVKRGFSNEWDLYISKKSLSYFEDLVNTSDTWEQASLDSAANMMVIALSREVAGSMGIKDVTNSWYFAV